MTANIKAHIITLSIATIVSALVLLQTFYPDIGKFLFSLVAASMMLCIVYFGVYVLVRIYIDPDF